MSMQLQSLFTQRVLMDVTGEADRRSTVKAQVERKKEEFRHGKSVFQVPQATSQVSLVSPPLPKFLGPRVGRKIKMPDKEAMMPDTVSMMPFSTAMMPFGTPEVQEVKDKPRECLSTLSPVFSTQESTGLDFQEGNFDEKSLKPVMMPFSGFITSILGPGVARTPTHGKEQVGKDRDTEIGPGEGEIGQNERKNAEKREKAVFMMPFDPAMMPFDQTKVPKPPKTTPSTPPSNSRALSMLFSQAGPWAPPIFLEKPPLHLI